MNVNDIMTKLPTQSEMDIHWRAVPSLREIWAEERQRMAQLLPPKENFLSGDNGDLSYTLSVKKGARTPGSKSAFDGNKQLFNASPSLETDFQRAMNDIIEKYEPILDNLESRFDEKTKEDNNYLNVKQSKHQNLATLLSQRDEALSALEALADQFSEETNSIPTEDILSPSQHEFESRGNGLLYAPIKSSRLSQLQPIIPSMTQADREEVQESLEFCMKIDSVEYGSIEDVDPYSLTPSDEIYDDNVIDEEENMLEEELEKSLTILGTQKDETDAEVLSQLDTVINNALSGSQTKSTFDGFALGQDSISSSDLIKSLSPNINEDEIKTPTSKRKIISFLSGDSPAIGIKSGDMIELKERPPNRDAFDKSSQLFLYPCHGNNVKAVPWLGFKNDSHPLESDSSFWRGSFLQPVHGPPASAQVRKWVGRKRRSVERNPLELRKGKDELEFDANSRKLLRTNNESKTKRRVVFASDTLVSSAKVASVEEVSWVEGNQRCTQDLSSTPSSQGYLEECTMNNINKSLDNPSTFLKGNCCPAATQISPFTINSDSPGVKDPLQGIGQQGGKIFVEGGGLKATVSVGNLNRQKLLSMMSIEVHVQCRIGKAGINNATEIAMKPDATRDKIFAVFYVYAVDPGGGEQIEIKERGCVLVPTENEINSLRKGESDDNPLHLVSKIGKTMGISSQMKVETVCNELQLLLRIASIVQWKDPDALMSWDTQSGGLGYLIDRGFAMGSSDNESAKKLKILDMIRLLGRIPKQKSQSKDENDTESKNAKTFTGSILGSEWDNRVGAGAGPSSIVSKNNRLF